MNYKKALENMEFFIPAALLIVMTLVVCLQVFMRYILGNPLSWPEEIARWCLVWITFGGISYGFAGGAFIGVDFFVKKLFPNNFEQIKIIDMIITTAFFVILTISGYLFTASTISNGVFMPVTRMPAAVSNIAIFIGSLLGIFRSFGYFFEEYKNN